MQTTVKAMRNKGTKMSKCGPSQKSSASLPPKEQDQGVAAVVNPDPKEATAPGDGERKHRKDMVIGRGKHVRFMSPTHGQFTDRGHTPRPVTSTRKGGTRDPILHQKLDTILTEINALKRTVALNASISTTLTPLRAGFKSLMGRVNEVPKLMPGAQGASSREKVTSLITEMKEFASKMDSTLVTYSDNPMWLLFGTWVATALICPTPSTPLRGWYSGGIRSPRRRGEVSYRHPFMPWHQPWSLL